MIHAEKALYYGEETPDVFKGSFAEQSIFCVMEAGDGYTSEEGHQALALIKDILHEHAGNNLTDVDNKIKQLIREGNLPSRVSVALGILKHDAAYLKTLGNGQIWLKRGSDFAVLIKGNQSATGQLNSEDLLLFTTDTFISTLAAPSSLSSFVENASLSAGVEELSTFMKNKGRSEGIALFTKISKPVHAHETQTAIQTAPVDQNNTTVAPPTKKKLTLPKLPDFSALLQTNKKKKMITLGLVLIIVLILIWSVGFGYKRRMSAQALDKINHTKEIVTQKLDQSDEVAFLNPQRSMVLINEANNEVSLLRKEVGDEYQKEVDTIASLVKEREDQITHKENKKADEFFDLTVDTKNAEGTKMALGKDQLAILDTKNGNIYSLSIEKKSLDKFSVSEAKSAGIPVLDEDSILFFAQGKGLFKINDSGKAVKVMDADKDLGSVTDIKTFNGNLYFLASSQNDIFKYIPTENGYSEKSSYIKSGQGISFKDASSLAIDSSIYIANGDSIMKFTTGNSDEFKTVFPDDGVQINKVITNADIEKVYAWDKAAGVIYILGKNGTYERQVKSSAFAKADDVVVFGTSAYTLEKAKIYKVGLE